MEATGYYYLTTDGDLVPVKEDPTNDENTYVCVWPVDDSDRYNAWKIATEALALGANKERVLELKEKWELTDLDAHTYAQLTGIPLDKKEDTWIAGEGEAVGKGETALEAIAAFVKEYMPLHQEKMDQQYEAFEKKRVTKPRKRKGPRKFKT